MPGHARACCPLWRWRPTKSLDQLHLGWKQRWAILSYVFQFGSLLELDPIYPFLKDLKQISASLDNQHLIWKLACYNLWIYPQVLMFVPTWALGFWIFLNITFTLGVHAGLAVPQASKNPQSWTPGGLSEKRRLLMLYKNVIACMCKMVWMDKKYYCGTSHAHAMDNVRHINLYTIDR